MPGNVAVKKPQTWVVKGPCDDHMAVRGHGGRITTLRILCLPSVRFPVPLGDAARKHEEVMTVEMHWVRDAVW